MSGNFEVLPCGTQARLAAVEAECDSLREILADIPPIEAELAETSDRLHAMTVERDALLEALRLIEMDARVMRPYVGQVTKLGEIARAAIAQTKGGGNG